MEGLDKVLKECSVADVFCSNGGVAVIYQIPIYQRNYAWGREEIRALIKEVYDAFSAKNNHTMIYLLFTNLLAFIAFGIDKRKARRGQWRIPESTLLTLAAIGGSVGAWTGMKVWHHKTLHPKFKYGIPAIFAIHLILLAVLCLHR